MQDSISQKLITPGGDASYNYTDEIYNIRLKDPKTGILIPTSIIRELYIDENMFSLLSTFKLVIEDKGAFFSGINLKNGEKIYFQITPNITVVGEEPKPYIDAEYCIQSITCLPDIGTNNYVYTIVGIYNSQNYLNEIATYPKHNKLAAFNSTRYTSTEAIKEVISDTNLKFINHIKSNDKSLWINGQNNRAQFIDKIVNHAWIEEGDSPLIYSDLNGNAHYTSIKTLCKNKYMVKFEHIKYHYDRNKSDIQDELTMLYGDVDFLNASGPILNQGGYTISEIYYTPYNKTKLKEKDIAVTDTNFAKQMANLLLSSKDISVTDLVTAKMLANRTSGKCRKITYKNNDTYLSMENNKDSSQLNRITKNVNAGMHFQDFHDYYDIAPAHNEMVRRSFFQNFVNMLVDVHRLPDDFRNDKCRPKLGNKIYIDFSNIDSIDKIHSGNYIICGIKHCFKMGHSYTMQMYCVTDGTFGKGVLE